MNKILNAKQVERVFLDCLFKAGEDTTNHVKAEGITTTSWISPRASGKSQGRDRSHAGRASNRVHEVWRGGWSFLNACNDKNGCQWTDFQQRMEQLFQLGIAIGKVECQLPRFVWPALPGGVPYDIVNN